MRACCRPAPPRKPHLTFPPLPLPHVHTQEESKPPAMSLDTLPDQLFAEVTSWLYEKVGRYVEVPSSRIRTSVACTFEHDAKATLQCFSPLSKTLHTLVRQMQQLYLHVHDIEGEERGPACKPAIALGCSMSVVDGRIASLFASSFRSVAVQLLIVDLRLTAITAASVITILQTCPSLEELDVGGCERLNVLELASSLEEVSRESLAVGRLRLRRWKFVGAGVTKIGWAIGNRCYLGMRI